MFKAKNLGMKYLTDFLHLPVVKTDLMVCRHFWCLSVFLLFPSLSLSLCLSLYLSVCRSVCPSVSLSVCMSVCLSNIFGGHNWSQTVFWSFKTKFITLSKLFQLKPLSNVYTKGQKKMITINRKIEKNDNNKQKLKIKW